MRRGAAEDLQVGVLSVERRWQAAQKEPDGLASRWRPGGQDLTCHLIGDQRKRSTLFDQRPE